MRKILIFFSDTGGGHRAAAEAIREAIQRRYADRYQVVLADGIVQAALPPFNLVPKLYLPTTKYSPWGWGLLFNVTNSQWGARVLTPIVQWVAGRGLTNILARENPDLVVTVHPLLTRVPARAWSRLKPAAPFVTVVTDLFDAHVMWFTAPADLLIVPTEGAREHGISWGFAPDRIRVVGLPVSLKFARTGTGPVPEPAGAPCELRQRLGLAPDLFTLLIVGGGEGMGQIAEITRAIANSGLPIQLAVIAGRNGALRKELGAETWPLPVRVEGFVTNMPEWLLASDLVVTKAGPGTIMETLAAGRPLLLSGYLPGQERGNVEFVVKTGVGVLRVTPRAIVQQLREWLAPGNTALEQMRQRAREQARPNAALEIAELLDELLVKLT